MSTKDNKQASTKSESENIFYRLNLPKMQLFSFIIIIETKSDIFYFFVCLHCKKSLPSSFHFRLKFFFGLATVFFIDYQSINQKQVPKIESYFDNFQSDMICLS